MKLFALFVAGLNALSCQTGEFNIDGTDTMSGGTTCRAEDNMCAIEVRMRTDNDGVAAVESTHAYCTTVAACNDNVAQNDDTPFHALTQCINAGLASKPRARDPQSVCRACDATDAFNTFATFGVNHVF